MKMKDNSSCLLIKDCISKLHSRFGYQHDGIKNAS